MQTKIPALTLFATAGVSAAIAMAPVAAAAPQCTSVGPNTTQCQTNGSSSIVTSPQHSGYYGGFGPYGGGLVIGFGGIGLGW
jgi:hypothetical protein